MKATDHLAQAKDLLVSFEIVPPKRGASFKSLEKVVAELARFKPPFIDVTSHAAQLLDQREGREGHQDQEEGNKVTKLRPGTSGICILIKHKYGIDAVPHVLCNGFSKEETENFLLDLGYGEIENVLALRGDDLGYQKFLGSGKTRNYSALELVQQLDNLRKGNYLNGSGTPLDLCLGIAGYPEKHALAVDFQADILSTRQKVDAGANYIVTQMFFDNSAYFRYRELCNQAGITVPIIPGLKILTGKEQLHILPEKFYCHIPEQLAEQVHAAKSKQEIEHLGVEWAVQQVKKLREYGVPAVHFYVMLNAAPVCRLMERLKEEKEILGY